jgi:predicted nucleic acid-binding protein
LKVLVDTCVWSQALRHKTPDIEVIKKLTGLVQDNRAVLIGPIRQELLSGLPHPEQFARLKEVLDAFEDIPLEGPVFIKAAEFCNICRAHGIQGSTIDFLICAVAYTHELAIYSTDKDFIFFSKYLPIKLLE